MWTALLLMVIMSGLLVTAIWPAVKPSRSADTAERTSAVVRPAGPVSLEGALVGQLSGGAITRGQYLRAMEQLAARDDLRHPLKAPSEPGPGEA